MIKRVTDLYPQGLIDALLPLGREQVPWAYLKTMGEKDGYSLYTVILSPPVYLKRTAEKLRQIAGELESGMTSPAGIGNTGGSSLMGLVNLSKWIASGPKIAHPGEERCEALSHIEVRLRVDEIALPFPHVMVELPPLPQFGPYCRVLVSKWEDPRTGFPILATNTMSPGNDEDIISIIRDRDDIPNWCVENTLDKFEPGCEGVEHFSKVASRVGINTCLMLSGHFEAALPNDFLNDRRLAREHTERGKKARDRLTTAVQIATFDSSIVFKKSEGGHPRGEPTGREVSTHWRRGHWRMQACGTGRAERKRILIAPVLVRKDLFVGDLSDTSTFYS